MSLSKENHNILAFEDFVRNRSRLEIAGFQKQEAAVTKQIVYPPAGMGAAQWWRHFEAKVEHAISQKKYLAVYRASHGEFSFVTGRNERPNRLLPRLRHYGSRLFYGLRFLSTFYSGSRGYGYETYRQWELPRLRKHLANCLRELGDDLVLCLYFSDRDAYPKHIQKSFYDWCCKNGLRFTPDNYGHIYFVYALFTGLKSDQFFRGKRVLIITHLTPGKKAGIESSMRERGAKAVDFVPITRSHSMRDKIAIDAGLSPDLCIIGGGVGAANILWQLKKSGIQCPCIDAGFVLDILSDREFARRRIYCINDDAWDGLYSGQYPTWAEKFSDKYSYWPEVRNGTGNE
jgi:hypothetical protein